METFRNEKLIAEVFKRPVIWDQMNKNHHNRYVLDKNWEEVSKVLKTGKKIVRSKWKYLRDFFRKELSKLRSEQAGGSQDNIVPSWPYFQSLLFLKNQMEIRSTTGNFLEEIPIELISDTTFETKKEVEDSQSIINEYCCSTSASLSESITAEKNTNESIIGSADSGFRKRKQSSQNDGLSQALIALEEETLKCYKKNKLKKEKSNNEDVKFFESLLPHVQKIPQNKKLLFRNKVQDLVQMFAYGNNEDNI